MRWFLLWLFLLGSVRPGCAQDTLPAARLRRQLLTAPADTSRVRLLTQLCYLLHDEAPARALPYGEQAVTLARRLPDKSALLRALLTLGSCYANLSDGPQALQLQQEALSLALRLRDAEGTVRGYAAIGSIYHERGDSTAALRYYRLGLAEAPSPAVSLRTRLMLYGNLGSLLLFMRRPAEGMRYTQQAMELAHRSGDLASEAVYRGHIGTHYLRQNQLPQAETEVRAALRLSTQADNPRVQASQLTLLATCLLLRGKLDAAETYARRALRLGRRIGYPERVLDAYDLMASINQDRNDYEQAYGWRQLYMGLNDTINSQSRLRTLSAMQTRYETRAKENQIRLLTQRGQIQQLRNRVLWGVVGTLLLGLAGMGVLTWQLRRSQRALAASNAALEQANTTARQLAASKDRLYAIVAHDLRGPVTSFAGVTELIDLYLRTGDEEGLRQLPGQVRQAAQRLNSLLDNLLNWAVTQTGELAFAPEHLPLPALLQETADLHRPAAEARQVSLTCTAPPDLTTWADAHMLRTVLRNLLSNALRATPRGGQVHLAATHCPATCFVLLTVTDTGRGMSPEQVQALLQPLQTPALLPHSRTGTGLGWPLCRAFVQRHGGELRIRSTAGSGTAVEVRLPPTTVAAS